MNNKYFWKLSFDETPVPDQWESVYLINGFYKSRLISLIIVVWNRIIMMMMIIMEIEIDRKIDKLRVSPSLSFLYYCSYNPFNQLFQFYTIYKSTHYQYEEKLESIHFCLIPF